MNGEPDSKDVSDNERHRLGSVSNNKMALLKIIFKAGWLWHIFFLVKSLKSL